MKNQKIVITGALGYIGYELCKLYSGETRYKEIYATDVKFLSDQVKQLTDWGFKFVQLNILDAVKIKELCHDADVVHHLAGITDVSYTKTESSELKDKSIADTAIMGTNNILNALSKTAKLVFPSTHVIYEGLTDTKFNLTEEETPTPILAYSKSKYQNEQQIYASGKKYVILRLASAYGYSGDTMRLNIMPNLFSKMAAQNLQIKLFSGGVQYKSLVSVIDIARCFKFFAENNTTNEVFHLSNENKTVADVANICKKLKPDLNIVSTSDEIPNLGYTLSNKKLLSTGFKFLYNLEDSIQEMINNWTPRKKQDDLEFIISGGKEYVDNRGKILNYELTEPINLIGYIESKKGTVRANHYHPIQEQKCLLIKGKYISVVKDLSDPKATIQTRIINEGDIAVIQPNVAHTMVFLEDSVFLNLVRGEREHANYGITHTIPYILVDDTFRQNLLNNYATKCRNSKSANIKPVLSLGLSPLANNLLDSVDQIDELYPLELTYCSDSHNCQLSYVVPANKMFDHYLYVSSTAKSFREHFTNAAQKYISEFNLNSDTLVVDIGSNDGIALAPLKTNGVKVLGVEPAKNIAAIAIQNGIATINNYFTDNVVDDIIILYGKAKLVTASNVFAHADGLEEIAKSTFKLLEDNGTFIIEVQYLLDTIKDLTFDNIYHEHVNYWSVTSLNNFFTRLGLYITKVEHVNTHGGSIRVYINRTDTIKDSSVEEFIQNEESFGLTKYSTYLDFAKRVQTAKTNVNKHIAALKNKGLTLVGYGSPAKATTALNYYGITSNEISYIIEDNKLKHNKILPGVKIPIFSKDKINEIKPDIIIVLAWNFFNEIKKNNQELVDKGIKFINIKDLQSDELIYE
jgi:nucleoside-diphosphate-sugar epimerase/quercetin dioxygenase-like cupin family protein/2-polyprenyl-3-methyl-5-hydroxy-6-metoxy-1,4-benzoquinol methylase